MDRRTLLRDMSTAAIGGLALGAVAPLAWRTARGQTQTFPDIIVNPEELTGSAAQPVIGSLPGANRMYVLPDRKGEFHKIGSMVMTRIARPVEMKGLYEIMTFDGPAGSAMPAHARLDSHACLLVMTGQFDIQLGNQVWRALRGDFVNVPPGAVLSWKMQSNGSRLVLYTSGARAGAAFVAMGTPVRSPATPATAAPVSAERIALASLRGDFQPRMHEAVSTPPVRISNMTLPSGPEPYVLLDGGGEYYGPSGFLARGRNTSGQFLVVIGVGNQLNRVGAHFHARHAEDFFVLDGQLYAWCQGQAVLVNPYGFYHSPPRNLHGFKMVQNFNRSVSFLTTGIFEEFFPALANGTPIGSLRGPDGYPLDVHAHKKPLPPEDPIWADTPPVEPFSVADLKGELLMHAQICSDRPGKQLPMSPALAALMRLKPRSEDFI